MKVSDIEQNCWFADGYSGRSQSFFASMKQSPVTFSSSAFNQRSPHVTAVHYENGETIFAQGDLADGVFRIETGNIKLVVRSKIGKQAVVALLRAGQCFGESCLLSDATRESTATSIQHSTILSVRKRAIVGRLKREPPLSKLLAAHLLLRAQRAEEDLIDQIMNSSERRLARLLLHLCDFEALGEDAPATMNVDQGTLALVIGTTRSRVSHFMNQFRKKGFIEYNGTLRVHKSLLLFLTPEQV